jgi:hypothetical protein
MSSLELKVYELFKKRFSEDEAQKKDVFLTKDDKIDIIKSIYTANIIQFIAIK